MYFSMITTHALMDFAYRQRGRRARKCGSCSLLNEHWNRPECPVQFPRRRPPVLSAVVERSFPGRNSSIGLGKTS